LPKRWFGPVSWSILAAFAHIGGQLLLARLWLIPHNGLFLSGAAFRRAALAFGIINGLIAARLLAELSPPNPRSPMPKTICLAFTGASGMPYGVRLLECLLAAGCRVQLLYSQVAQIVARRKWRWNLPARASEAQAAFRERFAALPGIARSLWPRGMVRAGRQRLESARRDDRLPCTMGTLASIAQGLASNLIERAADVVLKEGRKLVLVPRETPFSAIHLENMLRLARAGAVILPPNPGFYHHPQMRRRLVDSSSRAFSTRCACRIR
jgi:4-hydroxy-3-polyprenylbenzoate decarboxylase